MSKFDIIEFLSGLTGYVFDKAVLKRIALERSVYDVKDYIELTTQDVDLLRADLLYTAYLSPNVWASSTNQHGSFARTVGSQTIYASEREKLYNIFYNIYKKYNDEKLEGLDNVGGTLEWLP
jgi:hypothetical protein